MLHFRKVTLAETKFNPQELVATIQTRSKGGFNFSCGSGPGERLRNCRGIKVVGLDCLLREEGSLFFACDGVDL